MKSAPRRPKPTPAARRPAARTQPKPARAADEQDPNAGSARLRLLKVAVQPTFVLVNDAGGAEEVTANAFEVKGNDWSTWAQTAFDDDALARVLSVVTRAPDNGA